MSSRSKLDRPILDYPPTLSASLHKDTVHPNEATNMSDTSPARGYFTIEDYFLMSDCHFEPGKPTKYKGHVDKVLRKMGR